MPSSSNNSDPAALSLAAIGEVWGIAWPTVLTMTSYTVMQFVDKLMVAQVDPLNVAAQGNGGIWAFTPIAFAFGVLTCVNTYVSQNLGAGRPENGPKYAWAAFWISLIMWVCVLVPFALMLPWLFSRMHDPAVVEDVDRLIELETGYAQILLCGAVVLMVGKGVHNYFFGMHRPKVVTVSALLGNITNVILNYVLIFGDQGLPALGLPGVPGVPALGLYGAAIGTVVGTTVEVIIPAAIFLGPKLNAEVGSRAAWRPQWGPIRELFRIGWPACIQFGNEIICWSIFMVVLVGQFGAEHMTAGWAALGYMHLSFMPAMGASVAVTSLVGKYIGAGRPDLAVARARLGVGMSMIYMTCCAIVFFVFRYELIGLFVADDNVDPEQAAKIIEVGAKLMICAAVFQSVDAFGIVYTGALRGAGDTVWPGMITVIYSWSLIVGLGWLMIRWFPELESVGPWVAAAIYIIVYGITMAVRFERQRWRSINLIEPKGGGGAVPEAGDEAPDG